MTTARPRPVFILRLQPKAGVDTARAIRAILKVLLRRHGLRCLGLTEERAT